MIKTKTISANHVLNNGFLTKGLLWSLFISDGIWSSNVALFFKSYVFVAGVNNVFTVSKRIFYIQSVPAIMGRFSLLLKNSTSLPTIS